jgi:uncharacterized protein YodC (DUF2158 family)
MDRIKCKFRKGDIVVIKGIEGPKMIVTEPDRDDQFFIEDNEGGFNYGKVYCMYYDRNLTLTELSFDVDILQYATV